MTYFSFKQVRGSRAEEVYVGSMLIGRVAVKSDWRARLALTPASMDLYRAVLQSGAALSELYRSRHDAAEALLEATRQQDGPRG